jgi:hypothetical protein
MHNRSQTQLSWSGIMPADGNRAAHVGTGDFGTSPIFVQLSDKPLLASVSLFGVSERKAQWRIEKLRAADSIEADIGLLRMRQTKLWPHRIALLNFPAIAVSSAHKSGLNG